MSKAFARVRIQIDLGGKALKSRFYRVEILRETVDLSGG
jgi:hypothetical protein